MARKKTRLDQALVDLKLCESRNKAQALILAGDVRVNGQKVHKAAHPIRLEDDHVELLKKCRYVSRGGLKLEKGLEYFQLDPEKLSILDAGASTGGFTDCLLQHGAKRVLAVDVGYGQLAWSLRNDERVVSWEKHNVRHLKSDKLPFVLDAIVSDLSFISLKKVLPTLSKLFDTNNEAAWMLALIKPQFEYLDYASPSEAKAFDGVVRNEAQRKEVLNSVLSDLHKLMPDWACAGTTESPIQGPAGNIEFLSLWQRRRLELG